MLSLSKSWCLGLIIVALASPLNLGHAKERQAPRREEAKQAVQEALQREIYGLQEDRARLLEQAAAKTPDYAPAMWHRGYIRDHRNQWVTIDEYVQSKASETKLAAYQRERASAPDTVDGHLRLAEFCEERGLTEQRRAHLSAALKLDSNNVVARRGLGFVRVGGAWLSPRQLQADFELAREAQNSLEKWSKSLSEIRRLMGQRSQLKQTSASERLQAIADPSAIPAMEKIVSTLSDDAAKQVIETLAAMTDPKASLSLARHALYYPSLAVRELAAEQLQVRDKFSYVPQLLGMMYTPVTSQFLAAPTASGSIGLRHAFVREGAESKQMLVLDSEFYRVSLPGGDRRTTQIRAWTAALATATNREVEARRQNQFTEQLNEQIGWVLARATEQDLAAQPQSWWSWWNDYNDMQKDTDKSTDYVQQYTSSAIVDQPVVGSSGGAVAAECLVAGTPIWTLAGPKAIETIRVGDMILSQNVETGELAFKPALQTTVRDVRPLIKFEVDGETVETTRGHVFWVSGDGWMKAAELRSGMPLHTPTGSAPISWVEQSGEARTYNVLVADFNTYFVGDAKLLSHDVTIRQPASTTVPGLVQE